MKRTEILLLFLCTRETVDSGQHKVEFSKLLMEIVEGKSLELFEVGEFRQRGEEGVL